MLVDYIKHELVKMASGDLTPKAIDVASKTTLGIAGIGAPAHKPVIRAARKNVKRSVKATKLLMLLGIVPTVQMSRSDIAETAKKELKQF